MFIETNFQSGNISQVNQLVQSGGKFENAQVVIQDERAGLHEDDMVLKYILFSEIVMEIVSTGTTDATC